MFVCWVKKHKWQNIISKLFWWYQCGFCQILQNTINPPSSFSQVINQPVVVFVAMQIRQFRIKIYCLSFLKLMLLLDLNIVNHWSLVTACGSFPMRCAWQKKRGKLHFLAVGKKNKCIFCAIVGFCFINIIDYQERKKIIRDYFLKWKAYNLVTS